jgi:hypothetical protein
MKVSRRVLPLWVLIGSLTLLVGSATPLRAQPGPAALESLTGEWKGPFVTYTPEGKQVDSLTATHRYRWEGDVQVGRQVDRYPTDGLCGKRPATM